MKTGRSDPPPRRATMALTLTVMSVFLPGPAYGENDCGSSISQPTKNPEGVPSGVAEASGLVASQRYPGVGWAHQDSGHDASLFALRFDENGRALSMRKIPVVGAHNADWEDVSYHLGVDGVGRLYVVESGDFGSRMIYEIQEPDPDTASTAQVLGRYRYSLPDRPTTVEASFMFGDRLALVTKNFPARVYLFEAPLRPEGNNEPVFQGELEDSNGISVARLTSDGRHLVTATHQILRVYRTTSPGTLAGFFDREPAHGGEVFPGDNVEAGDFLPVGDCRLLLVAETRTTYAVGTN